VPFLIRPRQGMAERVGSPAGGDADWMISPRSPILGVPPAPLPPRGEMRRASSLPAVEASEIGQDGCRRRHQRRKSPDQATIQLARAVDMLAGQVDSLREQLADKCKSAAIGSKVTEQLESLGAFLVQQQQSQQHWDQQRELQQEQQRKQLDQQEAARTRMLDHLTEAIRGLSSNRLAAASANIAGPKSSSSSPGATLQPPSRGQTPGTCKPRYGPRLGQDDWLCEFPDVQIAVRVNQVGNVDTKQMTFEADFVCCLDWCDPVVEHIPPDELERLDWTQYFNPQVEIDNAKSQSDWLDGLDDVPRRVKPSSDPHGKSPDAAAGNRFGGNHHLEHGPHLRKTLRFRGTLALTSVNLKCFPFDIQVLPIKLKAARCQSLALGTPSMWQVSTPGQQELEQVGFVNLISNPLMLWSQSYRNAKPQMRGQGHHAAPGAGDALLEFRICGLTGTCPDSERGDVYEVNIFVERPFFASYFWDLVILNLLVMLAASAFWDTAAPELSSRMSISLTIILTLAAYTSSRPEPIAKAPYVTFHDWCEQISMFLVTGISVQNVFAVVMCGGQHQEAPPHMVTEFEQNRENCEQGWCKSRNIDCRALICLLCTWLALSIYSVCWLIRTRRRATLDLRQRLLFLGTSKDEFSKTGQPVDSSDTIGSWTYSMNRRCFGRCFAQCHSLLCCSSYCSLCCRCCRRRCLSRATEVKEAHGAEVDIPDPGLAQPSSLVGTSSEGAAPSSASSSPTRPRPRPLSFTPDENGTSNPCSPAASTPGSHARARSRPSRTSATPPTSARFGVPASVSPAAASCGRPSPWGSVNKQEVAATLVQASAAPDHPQRGSASISVNKGQEPLGRRYQILE